MNLNIADQISKLAQADGAKIAVAESLTSGAIGTALGKVPNATECFLGGVIAYQKEVKFNILGVDPGRVITAVCAEQMARGVAQLLKADIAVSVTGVGGPDPVEEMPPGTVFLGIYRRVLPARPASG